MEADVFRIPPPISGGSGDVGEVTDAPAESSPAPDSPTPPAATQPGTPGDGQQPPQQKPAQTVPYDRFREVIGQNQQLRQTVAQMQGRLQQMETLSQKAQQQGGLSTEDQRTYQEAAAALKQIFSADPELKQLLEMMKNGQQLLGTQQTVQSLRDAQLRQMEQQGVQRILAYADQEGLPKDESSRKVFVKLVESMALTIPQAKERFAQGDLTLLDEAFDLAKPLLAHVKREGQTQLLDTKTKTRQLPPAPRGSAAGPPGLPKLDPSNPRAFASALHTAAAQHLSQS
jgi:hypothetical protein